MLARFALQLYDHSIRIAFNIMRLDLYHQFKQTGNSFVFIIRHRAVCRLFDKFTFQFMFYWSPFFDNTVCLHTELHVCAMHFLYVYCKAIKKLRTSMSIAKLALFERVSQKV